MIRRQRQEDCPEFEASLTYTALSRRKGRKQETKEWGGRQEGRRKGRRGRLVDLILFGELNFN